MKQSSSWLRLLPGANQTPDRISDCSVTRRTCRDGIGQNSFRISEIAHLPLALPIGEGGALDVEQELVRTIINLDAAKVVARADDRLAIFVRLALRLVARAKWGPSQS